MSNFLRSGLRQVSGIGGWRRASWLERWPRKRPHRCRLRWPSSLRESCASYTTSACWSGRRRLRLWRHAWSWWRSDPVDSYWTGKRSMTLSLMVCFTSIVLFLLACCWYVCLMLFVWSGGVNRIGGICAVSGFTGTLGAVKLRHACNVESKF